MKPHYIEKMMVMELHLIDLIMLYKTLSFQTMLVALKKQVAMIGNAYQGQDYRGSQHLMASLLQSEATEFCQQVHSLGTRSRPQMKPWSRQIF